MAEIRHGRYAAEIEGDFVVCRAVSLQHNSSAWLRLRAAADGHRSRETVPVRGPARP